MTTQVYIDKHGNRTTVFHRHNKEAWEHPWSERDQCERCVPTKPREKQERRKK